MVVGERADFYGLQKDHYSISAGGFMIESSAEGPISPKLWAIYSLG
jgi:hypothetical protein